MKRSLLFIIALFVVVIALLTSCNKKSNKKENAPQKVVSLDLNDPTVFNELVHFYITNDIIPSEAVLCDHESNGGVHTFECLNDRIHDFV